MHYVIGDVQGCYDELRRLLDKVRFDDSKDRITFSGDMLNRGPESKSVIKFIVKNQHCMDAVLGNHDLHFLCLYARLRVAEPNDTLQELLEYKKVDAIANWLLKQPLCSEIEKTFLVCHAGLYPLWTPNKALKYSKQVSNMLQSRGWRAFLKTLYGNRPNRWNPKDKVCDRLRFIVNAFTRMRYLDQDCQLNFSLKGPIDPASSSSLTPWFNHPSTRNKTHTILFGHWSAIGAAKRHKSISLDGGCVWGRDLCAINIKNSTLIRVNATCT